VTARIGLLGGTFDPIHCGHIDAAIASRDALRLERVLLVPSHIPPHRPAQPLASAFHRFAMTALAVNGLDRLVASDNELRADGPSYTADTLDRLHRAGHPASQIFFITGVDAFAEIATWRRYPEVLGLAHFVVVSRPGYSHASLRERLPVLVPRMREIGTGPVLDAQPSILLLDAATRDVSSSMLRSRLRDGLSISGMVPPAVETHIEQHHLYRAGEPHAAPVARADELHGQN